MVRQFCQLYSSALPALVGNNLADFSTFILLTAQLRAGDTLLMEAMLEAGAEPNQKDLRGETALQVGSLICATMKPTVMNQPTVRNCFAGGKV